MTGPRENRTHLIFCVQDRRPRHAVPKPKYATYLCIDGVANHLRLKFASLQRIPREGWCWRKDSNLQINDPKSFVYANSTTPANKEFYHPHCEDSNFVSRWTRTNFYSFGFPEPIALINVSIATTSQ